MSAFRLVLFVTALIVLAGTGAAVDPPLGPKMEFDKKERENPSAPKGNQIKATGTFLLTEGYTLVEVQVSYRGAGTKAWKLADQEHVKIAEKVKDGRRAWEVVIKEVPAGGYEVKGQLLTKYIGLESKVMFETEPLRKVSVHDGDSK